MNLRLIGVFLTAMTAAVSWGQTNSPQIRLAIVPANPGAATVSDLLTAELSQRPGVQLLERAEIDRVYREQQLSAGTTDSIKLGRMLGADGLLLIESEGGGKTVVLSSRLVAVRCGVILTTRRFDAPGSDLSRWSADFVDQLQPLFAKLGVKAGDAIPISVVNLRSAVQMDRGLELERQVKLLTIQRLGREPRFFVLEREKMQLLVEEKGLGADSSAFWNGRYLLEGTIDRDGYSPQRATIHARLVPPSGEPLLIEVAADRTNLFELVESLVSRVGKAFQMDTPRRDWSAANEALRYLNEATWAVKWKAFEEAHAGAEAAWALGKQDAECARIRVQARLVPLPHVYDRLEEGFMTTTPGLERLTDEDMKEISASRVAAVFERRFGGIEYAAVKKAPDPDHIGTTLHALALYLDLSRTLPGAPITNSTWYYLGLDALELASEELQQFYLARTKDEKVASDLAELRRLAREVSGWMVASPTVVEAHNERSVFRSLVKWGSLWQERPEDCIALYRHLMSSPTFVALHKGLWLREVSVPRVTAWNPSDQTRVALVWNRFVNELAASSNIVERLEACAFAMADAQDDAELERAYDRLLETLLADADGRWAGDTGAGHYRWGIYELLSHIKIVTPGKEKIESRLRGTDQKRLDELSDRQRVVLQEKANQEHVEKQRQYLAKLTPFETSGFQRAFLFRQYSVTQALELRPLLAAYKSNLLAEMASQPEPSTRRGGRIPLQVTSLERSLERAINPPAVPPVSAPARSNPLAKGQPVAPPETTVPPPSEIPTNVFEVGNFLPIPLEGLKGHLTSASITGHHWQDNSLVLDLGREAWFYSFDTNGNFQSSRSAGLSAVAILDPITERWRVVDCPETDSFGKNPRYHRTVLLNGELYTCDGTEIRRYNEAAQRWDALPIPARSHYQLFAVNGRLYAADDLMVLEIQDGGRNTRILASRRRRPPASILDSQELGFPALFEGPGGTLRIAIPSGIFSWTENDWRKDCALPSASFHAEILAGGVVFRSHSGGPYPMASLSFMGKHSSAPELRLSHQDPIPRESVLRTPAVRPRPGPDPAARKKLPSDMAFSRMPATVFDRDLYVLVDHTETKDIVDEQQHVITGRQILARDGYHAALLCFSEDLAVPQKLFLKFRGEQAELPVVGSATHSPFPGPPPGWILFSTNNLYLGLETSFLGMTVGGMRPDKPPRIGVWTIPRSRIEAARVPEKQAELDRLARESNAIARARQELIDKYDLNRDGLVEGVERTPALENRSFVAGELSKIDTNGDFELDPAETAYFDANQNRLLDSPEQNGIDIALRLLAHKGIEKADLDADGILDRTEFEKAFQRVSEPPRRGGRSRGMVDPDQNRDGRVNEEELALFLELRLRRAVRDEGVDRAALVDRLAAGSQPLPDSRAMFKNDLELFWQRELNGRRP